MAIMQATVRFGRAIFRMDIRSHMVLTVRSYAYYEEILTVVLMRLREAVR